MADKFIMLESKIELACCLIFEKTIFFSGDLQKKILDQNGFYFEKEVSSIKLFKKYFLFYVFIT